MNKYFDYENRKYWDVDVWKDTISSIFGLVKWMGNNGTVDDSVYPSPLDGLYGDEAKKLACYDKKTNAVSIPEVVQYWKDRGVHYERRAQGGFGWLIMCPDKCLDDFAAKLPTLVVFHMVDLADPYWAMKTLEKYKAYNDMVAEQQDVMVYYICINRSDEGRVYVNILQEAFVFVAGDVNKVYLDVSNVYEQGVKLADIPDFVYRDDEGNVVNPDECVAPFGSARVPALDITGRWENKTSLTRDQVAMINWSNSYYDFDRVMYSETGKKMAEGMAVEYQYDKTTDEDFLNYWDAMGLTYVNHETKSRRWKAAVPKSAFENPAEKLPVICVMQEVNHANEHLAVTETSYFYEYFRICAQGACILINFVLEDAESNELLVDILEDAKKRYPMMDMTRVYIAGHSHNGHYPLEFAHRHSELITAVATFGDAPGLANSGITPMTPERAERASKVDMPVINLCGMCEMRSHYPISEDGSGYRPIAGPVKEMSTFKERAEGWRLRLKASGCPTKTDEEILATKNSEERAIRMLGVPGDKSEVIWIDGFELYIVYVKNNNGKYHLCMVGEENMPHNTTPAQQMVSWSFLRRFARDPQTGAIIEL